MKYMNDFDMDRTEHLYREHPVLRPATLTLRSLEQGVNACSDGWPYWQAPKRAAQKLMQLIDPDDVVPYDIDREDATPAKLQAAYTQLRRFRTSHPACGFRLYPADGVTNADPKAADIDHGDYDQGQKQGYESGLVLLAAEGQHPVAGFTVPLPGPLDARRDFLRGLGKGLIDASAEGE